MHNQIFQQHLRVIRMMQWLPPVLRRGIFLCYTHCLLIIQPTTTFKCSLTAIQPEASWASSAKWEFGGISVAAKNSRPHRQMRQDSPLEFQGLIVHISLPFI